MRKYSKGILLVVVGLCLGLGGWKTYTYIRNKKRMAKAIALQEMSSYHNFHFIKLGQVQKPDRLALGLHLSGAAANTKLKSCFEGKGKKCKDFAQPFASYQDPFFNGTEDYTLRGIRCSEKNAQGELDKNCWVRAILEYRILCSSDKACEGVELQFRTESLNPEKKFPPRSSRAMVNAKDLLNPQTAAKMNPMQAPLFMQMMQKAREAQMQKMQNGGLKGPPRLPPALPKAPAKKSGH